MGEEPQAVCGSKEDCVAWKLYIIIGGKSIRLKVSVIWADGEGKHKAGKKLRVRH